MPDFRFLGFREGAPVTLSLVQGALTRGPLTIPAWAQPVSGGGTGEVSISTITDGRLIAPTGVWFQATIGSGFIVGERTTGPNTYDPSFHEIDYVWTIQRPAGAASTFHPPLNMPNVWKNRNIAFGKQVAFVMDEPGSYTVTCTARDWAGNVGVATWTQTVADPDVAFSGANTICFSTAGNFAGAPAGSQQFTDVSAALAAYRNRPGDARFLFRRGETYTFPDLRTPQGNTGAGFIDFAFTTQTSNIRFGAFGTGAKTRLIAAPGTVFLTGATNHTYSEVCFYDLRFEGPWDAATETGESINCLSIHQMSAHVLLHRCEFSGHNISFGPSVNSQSLASGRGALPTNIVSETVITNWQNMGIFSHDAANSNICRLAVTGSSFYQKPDALGGRLSDKTTSNAHGPIRWSSGQCYIGASEFFALGGWSGGSGPGGVADQPCLRVISTAALNNVPTGDYYSNSERLVCEGGVTLVSHGATQSNGGGLHVPNNHLVDRFLTVGSAGTTEHFGAGSGGTTLRNGLMIQPNAPSGGGHMSRFIRWGPINNAGTPEAQSNYLQRMAAYNVTGIFLRSAAQNNSQNATLLDQSRVDLWQSKVVENNIFHAPNQGAPVTADGPFLSDLIAGFTPRYIGYRYNFPFIQQTTSGASPDVPPGGTVTFPYPAGTNQAHFTTNPIGPKSVFAFEVNLTPSNRMRAEFGQFTIAFTAGGIVVTNTSGVTWSPRGSQLRYMLSLDRTSELPPPLAAAATPANLDVLWTPVVGSPAIGSGNQGARTRDDLLVRTRAAPAWRGAIQPN